MVTWSSIPEDAVTFQVSGESVLATKNCTGNIITLTAQISIAGSTFSVSKENIAVGRPFMLVQESIIGLRHDALSEQYEVLEGIDNYKYSGKLFVNDYLGLATSYSWSKISHHPQNKIVNWIGNGNSVHVYSKVKDWGLILRCTASNSCGSYTRDYTFYTGNTAMLIYPNPATDRLTIELTADETENADMLLRTTRKTVVEPYIIQLWHERNGMVREIKSTERVTHISLLGLPKGMYFVHLQKDNEPIQKKLLWVK